MIKYVGFRSIRIVCFLFMMCPKRSMPLIDLGEEDRANLFPPSETSFDSEVDKLIQRTQENQHSTAEEPGFNFSIEEIKRLKIWPNGVVPFYIDIISYDKVLRDKIRSFLNSLNLATGIRFTELLEFPDNNTFRYVFFVNRKSELECPDVNYKRFTVKGPQKVVLGYHCMSFGDMSAVALAILGIPPQHNAPNRDQYISVQKKNILPEKRHLFEKVKNNEWLFHDLPYDFFSAGHYGYHKYTATGQASIKPKNASSLLTRVGEPQTLTNLDILKIKMVYNYITLKLRDDGQKIPCSKLFLPGKHINDISTSTTVKPLPRAKPKAFY